MAKDDSKIMEEVAKHLTTLYAERRARIDTQDKGGELLHAALRGVRVRGGVVTS